MRVTREVAAPTVPDGARPDRLPHRAGGPDQRAQARARRGRRRAVDGGDDLRVTVRSRRPVGVAAAALPGAGSGLIGLEERVTLAGGTITPGRTPPATSSCDARLPWSAS